MSIVRGAMAANKMAMDCKRGCDTCATRHSTGATARTQTTNKVWTQPSVNNPKHKLFVKQTD